MGQARTVALFIEPILLNIECLRAARAVKKIAILAYGSLIDEPGEELENCIVNRLGPILTPFKVEYARSSRTRGGAPTLVPVDGGGFQVSAVVFVLSDAMSEKEAKDMLWRRETRRAHGSYSPPARPGPNSVLIKTILEFRRHRFGSVPIYSGQYPLPVDRTEAGLFSNRQRSKS